MKLPVGQEESNDELVAFVPCAVIGWVSAVCTGDDEGVSEMERMKELCSICGEKSAPHPQH